MSSYRPASASASRAAQSRILLSLPWSVDQTVVTLVRAGIAKDDARLLQAQDVDGDAIAFLNDEALARMAIPTFGRRVKVLRVVQNVLDEEAERRGLQAPNVLNAGGTPASPSNAAGGDPYGQTLPRGASTSDPFLRRGGNSTASFQPQMTDRFNDDTNLLDPAALQPAESVGTTPKSRFGTLSNAVRTRDYGIAEEFNRHPKDNLVHHDLNDIDRDRDGEESKADAGYDSDVDRSFHHPRLDSQVAAYDPRLQTDPNDPFLHHDPATRARPWLGAIVPPTRHQGASMEPPSRKLQLEWVHGYRAFDSRSNLMYNAVGDIVYPVAGVCVVYTPRLRRQKWFFGHDDDIRCLTQHPLDKNLMASGQSGGIKDGVAVPPHICVWDSASGDLSRSYTLKCTQADKSIRALAFSGGEGRYLAAISNDSHYTMKIYDWKKRLLLTAAKSDTKEHPIYMVRGNPKDENEFVTVGKNHLLFWSFDGHVLKNKHGVLSGSFKSASASTSTAAGELPSFYSLTFSEKGYACLGGENGAIYVFVGGKCAKVFNGVHRGKILSLEWYNGGFVSGGSDGAVHVLDKKMDVAKSFQFSNKVTSVAIGGPHGNDGLLVGTQGADVFHIESFFDRDIAGDEKLDAVTRGHSDGELWALAVAGDGKHYVTAGEDNTICLWALESHRLLKRGILSDRKGHILTRHLHSAAPGTTSTHPVNQCARAIAISPNGAEIVVGTNEGELVIFDTRTFARKLSVPLASYKKDLRNKVDGTTHHRSAGNSSRSLWISTVQFSPSGHAVAVGTHGCVVVLLDVTSGYAVRSVIDRSNGAITAVDWSADGSLLQTNDTNFELFHYHVDEQDLKRVTPITNASSVRDVAWHTHTCTLSWMTSGVTRPEDMGQYVNTADANPSRTLIATGDDSGNVNLFRAPALPGAQPLRYSGHSAHVSKVAFTPDERFLLSAGGHDLSIMQWRVV